MEVLIVKENENVIRGIGINGITEILGGENYTQQVIMPKAGYRLCVLYNPDAKGKVNKLKLHSGEVITLRGTYIIAREEYGAYGDISLDDIGDVMLAMEVENAKKGKS